MYQYLGNTGIQLYGFLPIWGALAVFVYGLIRIRDKAQLQSRYLGRLCRYFQEKDKGWILKNNNFWLGFEILLIAAVQTQFVGGVNTWFGSVVGTGSNYYGTLFFWPFGMLLLFLLLGIREPLRQLDLITPGYPLFLIFVKLACFCQGCCRGVESPYGLYNYGTFAKEIPVQLLEAWAALWLFVLFACIRKYVKPGRMFPLYLISYSAIRFFTEFLRCEKSVLWILKTYHLLCIAGVLVGLAELLVVIAIDKRRREKRGISPVRAG